MSNFKRIQEALIESMNARHIESIKRAIDNGYFKPISKPLTPEDARRLVDTALEGLHASL